MKKKKELQLLFDSIKFSRPEGNLIFHGEGEQTTLDASALSLELEKYIISLKEIEKIHNENLLRAKKRLTFFAAFNPQMTIDRKPTIFSQFFPLNESGHRTNTDILDKILNYADLLDEEMPVKLPAPGNR